MKAVLTMTLWTQPGHWRHRGAEELWSLSTLRARRLVDDGHFSGLELHTDEFGAEWVTALGLPYTAIDVELKRRIPLEIGAVFGAAKLATYAAAMGPFFHLDGDVILRRSFPPHALAADFLFERSEPFNNFEPSHVDGWLLPASWQAAVSRGDRLMWQCGVAGGRCWQEFAAAAAAALEVLHLNASKITNVFFASQFAEQWGLARELDPWRVATLLPGQEKIANEAAAKNYRHFCGELKHDPAVQRRIQNALAQGWPAQLGVCASVARSFASPRAAV
jgi:hypothetical protein